MRRLVTLLFWVILILSLYLLLGTLFAIPARADTLYLPLLRGGYVVTVTGDAWWQGDIGPVVHRRFALLEVICEDPLVFRYNSQSPEARTDAQGQFVFENVPDGVYVLAIEWHPPFGWALIWQGTTLYLVVVEGESVEMGVVRVGVTHLWGE